MFGFDCVYALKKFFVSFVLAIGLLTLLTSSDTYAFYSTINVPSNYRNIGSPQDIVMLNDSTFWYVDSLNYRIVKMNTSGQVLRTVGRQGSDEGEFAYTLTSITKDSEGFLYVLSHERVYKLDFNGGFVESWGSLGNSGGAEFSNPTAIHFDSYDETLLISDTGNNRIARFSPDGDFVDDFGTSGTGDGQLAAPQGVTTDSSGNIYVVDVNNHRVQVFDGLGNFIRKFGGTTPGNYYFEFPKDLEVLSNGDIIVTSQNSNLIKKFDNTGVYIAEWSSTLPQYMAKASDDSVWVTGYDQKSIKHFSSVGVLVGEIKNSGTTSGSFTTPYDYDYDSSGNIYVIDDTARVQKFNSSGVYISTVIEGASQIGASAYHVAIGPASGNIVVSSERAVSVFDENGTFISNIGAGGGDWISDGTANGEFNHARDMAFDSNGYLYVVEYFNERVQKFDLSQVAAGDFLTTHNGGFVDSWPVMAIPLNIFIDDTDTVYVSPREASAEVLTVKKYNTTGDDLGNLISQFGSSSSQYWTISSIFIDNDDGDKLYITDSEFDRVQIYDSTGTWIETIGGSGSGANQFDYPSLATKHPTSGNIVVNDQGNHRLQILTSGVRIKNLTPSADVINQDNDLSLVSRTISPTSGLNGELYFGDYIVSDFTVDLSSDRDWNSVNVVIHPDDSKSLVVNLNPSDAPGIGNTHSLYVVKKDGQNTITVCPQADAISEVADGCTGAYNLTEGDSSLTSVTIDSVNYWKVTGLTGTGAYAHTTSLPAPTPGNSSTSSSSNNSSPSTTGTPSCSEQNVDGIPDLFQINTLSTSATIYFSPLSDTNQYFVSCSTSAHAEEHGTLVNLAREGVQNYTISHLSPNTTYYFKVRGQNGCKPGKWSTILAGKTTGNKIYSPAIFYKYGLIKSPAKKIYSPTPEPVLEIPSYDPVPFMSPIVTVTPSPSPLPPKAMEPKKQCFLWWCF